MEWPPRDYSTWLLKVQGSDPFPSGGMAIGLWRVCTSHNTNFDKLLIILFFLEIEDWQASAKAQEAIDHLASFSSSREKILQPGFEAQPLPWDLGISPPSSNRLRSSRTSNPHFLCNTWELMINYNGKFYVFYTSITIASTFHYKDIVPWHPVINLCCVVHSFTRC